MTIYSMGFQLGDIVRITPKIIGEVIEIKENRVTIRTANGARITADSDCFTKENDNE